MITLKLDWARLMDRTCPPAMNTTNPSRQHGSVGVVYIPATRAARSLPSFRRSRASQYGARWGALKRKDCARRIQRLTRTYKQINRHTETATDSQQASDQCTSEVSQHYDTSHWSDVHVVGQQAVQDSSTTHTHTLHTTWTLLHIN